MKKPDLSNAHFVDHLLGNGDVYEHARSGFRVKFFRIVFKVGAVSAFVAGLGQPVLVGVIEGVMDGF
jgi:hypothetical protein